MGQGANVVHLERVDEWISPAKGQRMHEWALKGTICMKILSLINNKGSGGGGN